MAKLGGTKTWIAAGIAVFLGLAMIPVLSGAASTSLVPSAATDPSSIPCSGVSSGGGSGSPSAATVAPALATDTSWAYGGQAWWNYTITFDSTTIVYNSSFGWTVVLSVTETSSGYWMIEEQRTLGITILKSVTTPKVTVNYCYHAQEDDVAFANITNHSTVYVNDAPVPALGIVNASVAVNGLVDQTLSLKNSTGTYTASLKATGKATASVSFSPSLGLIPLNLTKVHEWNSTSTATYAANWDFEYAYTELNGSSGSHSKTGSLSGTVPISLMGYDFGPHHPFSDHKSRIGVILVIQGPFNSYDGFILVPRAFDLFGGGVHPYDSFGFGTSSITSEDLYFSPGPGGLAITAADQSFGSVDVAGNAWIGSITEATPTASSYPSATVEGQPMTVAQAQSLDQKLTSVPGASAAGAAHTGGVVLVVLGVVIVAVVVTVGVIVWRSSSRRRSTGGFVGSYGMTGTNGVPPAVQSPRSPAGPSTPPSGPGSYEDPNRRL